MERKAVRRRVLPGIAMITALAAGVTGLAGCTDGNGIGITSDQKGGGSTAAPAQPGKYRSLPQPCKAADTKRLKAMLPASDSLTTQQREQLYAGTAEPSFDGDRHVGCRWNAQAPEGTLLLSVTFERVVSYDRAAASDDDKAHTVFVRRLTDAHLPFPGITSSPSPSTAPGASATPAQPSGSPSAPPAPASAPASASPSAPASPSTAPELGSRVLEGLGSEAYLDDKLSPAGASAAQSRTVRIVFRTSNVLVTIEYSVQPSGPAAIPSSAETQDKTRQLAQALAERFSE
ncbi:hypothetical protein SLAV_21625 [Streptomyces lavendulae subsp. lavendulae]|uniref:Uncharacterized protein n=1 Tax=Streptomyces lavendulae subsp. lavendulae TaxID=58340 RepID=A0A2K8PHC9_STRLA|nr:hypothetical protein [Streptomyces lavendulae]ATZ26142.1 hypothetical protein SLAV_21625 [Streptomyces lavendulae subsp. lavendulae]QUQ55971.1 hypothetical protein SLLC_19735 [Streptomyces lavendulae subsp. lavendulae]